MTPGRYILMNQSFGAFYLTLSHFHFILHSQLFQVKAGNFFSLDGFIYKVYCGKYENG